MIRAIAKFTFCEKRATGLAKYYCFGLLILFTCNAVTNMKGLSHDLSSFRHNRAYLEQQATLETTYALRAPRAVSFLSSSDKLILPSWLTVKPYEAVDAGGSTEPSDFLHDIDAIDWRVIIGMWCSLAAVLFASDAVSNRRSGVLLRFYWSFPISRRQYFCGKFLGQLSIVYLPLAFFGCLSLIAELIFQQSIGFTGYVVYVVGCSTMVLLSAIPFISFFIMLGWLSSILWNSESTSVLGALTIWTLLVWMWPALGMTMGQLTTYLQPYREASYEWDKLQSQAMGSLPSSYIMKIANLPVSEQEKMRRINELEREMEEQSEINIRKADVGARALRADFSMRRKQQTNKAILLASLSPYGQWKNLLDEITIAGYYSYIYFLEQASDYSDVFGQYTDRLKYQMRDKAHYKSIGTTSYGGYTLKQRAGRTYDHISLPQTAPPFSWRNQKSVLPIKPWLAGSGKLVAMAGILLIPVLVLLRKLSLV